MKINIYFGTPAFKLLLGYEAYNLFLFLVCVTSVKAQECDSYSITSLPNPSFTYKMDERATIICRDSLHGSLSLDYKQTKEWKKFKRLRAYGWTALGVGSVMVCMGTIICSVGTGLTGNDVGAMIVFPCTGAALVATSIPMLTIAYKNRRKAKSFSFTTSSLSVDLPNGEKQTQPALGLCLNF